MKAAARSRRDRIRAQLADLKMPRALESLDDVLTGVNGGGVTASEAIEQLLSAQITLRNNRRLQAVMRSSRLPAITTLADFDFTFQPSILAVDEIGYLPVSQTGAMLFFQLLNRRYEHASTVLTSNKGFEEWGDVLGDDVMAAALIDRLLHHCHIVNIRGNSYRMRHHRELSKTLHAPPAESRSSHPRRRGTTSKEITTT